MSYKGDVIRGPFQGIINSVPPPNSVPNAFDDVLNFFCRKGRVQTRPRFNASTAPPDNAILRNLLSFENEVGGLHTLALTTKNAYFITSGPTYNLLTYPGGVTDLSGTGFPYGLSKIVNRIYFANGSQKVMYVDGEASVKLVGDVPGSARFMTTQSAHLILGYTTEPEPLAANSIEHPQRVRWSKSGDPDDWTSFSSGFADLLEVPDNISGLASHGRNVIVFRTNGLSAMFPTGIGTAPFAFEHFSFAKKGVGNFYPYSLDTYANSSAFVAQDDIYLMSGISLTPIGKNTKKAIFKDLDQLSGGIITGTIIPSLGIGYDFLSYWLSIPGPDVTWVFHYDEGNWVRVSSSAGQLTTINTVLTD